MIKKKNISQEDINTWQNYIKNQNDISDKEQSYSLKPSNIRFKYDLHGYSLNEANETIKNLIYECYNKEINKLIIVTGKGLHSNNELNPYVSKNLSILKYSVPEYIENNKELMTMINEIQDANIEDGGSGAFYILLKKKFTK